MDVDEAHLLAFGNQIVHGLFGGFGGGSHENDDSLGIGSTVIVKEMIRAPSHTADLRHVVLYSFGNSIHLLVAGLTALEEDVRVDRGAAGSGMLRIQGVGPEGFQGFHINQGTQLLVIQCFNLLNLMRGAESIKEMQERHPTVDGGKVCHAPKSMTSCGEEDASIAKPVLRTPITSEWSPKMDRA